METASNNDSVDGEKVNSSQSNGKGVHSRQTYLRLVWSSDEIASRQVPAGYCSKEGRVEMTNSVRHKATTHGIGHDPQKSLSLEETQPPAQEQTILYTFHARDAAELDDLLSLWREQVVAVDKSALIVQVKAHPSAIEQFVWFYDALEVLDEYASCDETIH
jgi:acetolactate synthase small subunit